MLRSIALALGLLCLAGGAIAWDMTGFPVGLPAMIIGALLVLGIVFERVIYKPNAKGPPGPGWVKTTERFVDDQTGKPVTVYIRPETGEPMYVEE